MSNINGIGDNFIENYGNYFLTEIKKFTSVDGVEINDNEKTILSKLENRLVNINKRNRLLYSSKVNKDYGFDLFKFITNIDESKNLDKTYMDMLKSIIDEEQYVRVSENIKKEIKDNKSNIDNLKNENSETNKIDKKQIEKYIDEFLSLEKTTRELIINLAHKIYIYQDKTVDIIFTFKNIT